MSEWVKLSIAAKNLGVQKKLILRMIVNSPENIKKDEHGETLLSTKTVVDAARALGLEDEDINEFVDISSFDNKVKPKVEERTKWQYVVYNNCPVCKKKIFHSWCLIHGEACDNTRWIGVPYKSKF